MWQDFEAGSGVQPTDGEEVTFDYVAYNENGSRIDSSYNKGRPASTRLGINGLIPGAPSWCSIHWAGVSLILQAVEVLCL